MSRRHITDEPVVPDEVRRELSRHAEPPRGMRALGLEQQKRREWPMWWSTAAFFACGTVAVLVVGAVDGFH